MPPRIVHLVRHAEGFHNINWQHYLRDPLLTPKGHSQCAELASSFPYHDRVDKVLCSSLKRTILTAAESFEPAIERLSKADPKWRITTHPIFQETGEWECDIGTPLAELKEVFADKKYLPLLDWAEVEESQEWPEKTGIYEAENVGLRAKMARQYLHDDASLDGCEIVVITHGGFLHELTEDWNDYSDMMGTAWRNTEWRSYTLEKNVKGNPTFIETAESLQRRDFQSKDEMDETEKAEVEAGHHGH